MFLDVGGVLRVEIKFLAGAMFWWIVVAAGWPLGDLR